MSVELGHEALAEAHNLCIGFALRVKIGTALAAADRQSGQGVFKDLLKSEEFENSDVYGRMETKTALVRSDRAVELYAVSAVDLNLSVVIGPRNTEFDLALRLGQTLKQGEFSVLILVLLDDRANGLQNFADRLMELRLSRILLDHFRDHFIYICHSSVPPVFPIYASNYTIGLWRVQ